MFNFTYAHCLLTGNDIKEENISFVAPGKLSIAVLRTATNNFSEENKLGEGGFGEVFKVRRRIISLHMHPRSMFVHLHYV